MGNGEWGMGNGDLTPWSGSPFPVPRSPTLVIQTAHLGDVVLTLPLLQRIAERHGPVDVVTTPAAFPLVATHPLVRRAIAYDKHGHGRDTRSLISLGLALRDENYARVYLPHGSLRSAVLARLTGAPERLGFAGAPGALLYSTRVVRPAATHTVDRLLALVGSPGQPPLPWISLTDEDRTAAAGWLAARGITGQPLVLAPGARWGTKRWPYFPELAAQVDAEVVVLGGAEDADLGGAVVASAPGRANSAAGTLSLRESAAVIERASCVVTNDSLPLHLASALGRPVVAVFGPTVPAFGFGPVQAQDAVVEHLALSCRPCSRHGPRVCPLGHHRCMRELSVDQVLGALRRRLGLESA